jgi:acetoin utilization deacetylase AcuC-like enzyme
VLVVASDRHRQHSPRAEIESSGLQPPFEHPGRAEAIRAVLAVDDRFELVEPVEAGVGAITAVHDQGLVEFLARAWEDYQRVHPGTHDVVPDVFQMSGLLEGIGSFPDRSTIDGELGRWCFETTTPITEGTYAAARGAVDIAVTATDLVLAGDRVVYGLCRPPGHHAPRRLYGGYCFFNNAAIAANHAATSTGSRVTVLDIDYHHGNGTQQIFYRRDDIQYVSLHGDPARAYPYVTGFVDETGSGPGSGSTRNMPLPTGTDDDRYLSALQAACEAIAAFGPELIVVSLGVDTFHNDPISDLAVTADGFERQGALVAEMGLPTVVVQEGGYDVKALGDNVRRWLVGLRPESTDRPAV